MTPENKEKLFALYYRQKVACIKNHEADKTVSLTTCYPDLCYSWYKTYLLLTPLSQITDEDAAIAGLHEIQGVHPVKADWGREMIFMNEKNGVWRLETIDFLRSRGYALPFMGISVQQMVDDGVIKLTTVKQG